MAGYTKLFNSILASTIWEADMPTRIVWITLLAMADKHGIAEGSVPGLATFARVSLPQCRAALKALQEPDPDSRSHEKDGRRIEVIEGGWRLINHGKYRAKLGEDERREYLRVKQAEHRARKQSSTGVNTVSNKSTRSTHTEAKAEADPSAVDQDRCATTFVRFWAIYPNRKAKAAAVKAWQRLNPSDDLSAEIFAALDWQARQVDWTRDGGRFVPHASTWLNGRRWEDEAFDTVDPSDAAFERVIAGKGRLS